MSILYLHEMICFRIFFQSLTLKKRCVVIALVHSHVDCSVTYYYTYMGNEQFFRKKSKNPLITQGHTRKRKSLPFLFPLFGRGFSSLLQLIPIVRSWSAFLISSIRFLVTCSLWAKEGKERKRVNIVICIDRIVETGCFVSCRDDKEEYEGRRIATRAQRLVARLIVIVDSDKLRNKVARGDCTGVSPWKFRW